MRHKSILLLLVIALLMGGASSAAHSGRTDKNGGHRDSSTGEYHYHHGYPAHQHENGVCPYNYDDRTGWNSGSASSSKSTKTPKPEVIIEYVEVEKEQSKTGLYLLGGASGILLIFAFRKGALANARKAELENKIKEAQELRQIIMDLGGINPSRVIPKGTELGEDGSPAGGKSKQVFCLGRTVHVLYVKQQKNVSSAQLQACGIYSRKRGASTVLKAVQGLQSGTSRPELV